MPPNHIFIVGCARSGTTLLRQILSMSDRVSIAPETHYIRRFTRNSRWHANQWGDLHNTANLDRMIAFMYGGRRVAGSAYWSWLQRNVDRQVFRQRIYQSDRTERGIFEMLIELYAETTKGLVADHLIIGEKTPSHFHYIPTLLDWFPDAKIIHTFRDPRAILVSELKKMRKKKREGPWRIFKSAPSILLEPLELPFELLHTTRSWLAAAKWHKYCEQHYPQNYAFVRFEDLVTQPEKEICRLCDFGGIEFEPAMVSDVRVVGSGFQNQHRGGSGFDVGALTRWQASLNPALVLWFSLFLGEQLRYFGYA
ncbi:MAG: sulfotransferase [Chloroflexi bacterium]|nr:sulfotransferase [Chloroflexota bacterium]